MSGLVDALVAVTFAWFGMVAGISFLEAPLKFRAPGVTVPLGAGIGRLVFRALNIVEAALAAALITLAAFLGHPVVWLLAGILCALLTAGAGVVRPLMDRRVRRGLISDGRPRHSLHLWYVALEVAKVTTLIVLGVVLFRS